MMAVDDRGRFVSGDKLLLLLAYYAAKERGCPIDFPRNLAKSVTVE
jgi:glucosamine--fructose-6-phosphate aminotransferase (isomerizing)